MFLPVGEIGQEHGWGNLGLPENVFRNSESLFGSGRSIQQDWSTVCFRMDAIGQTDLREWVWFVRNALGKGIMSRNYF